MFQFQNFKLFNILGSRVVTALFVQDFARVFNIGYLLPSLSSFFLAIIRDVAKKKFSQLRYPLSWLTLEGACSFCVGAADTGGGYGRGWPPPIGGGPGGLPREILKI